jgi:hypothetical protein
LFVLLDGNLVTRCPVQTISKNKKVEFKAFYFFKYTKESREEQEEKEERKKNSRFFYDKMNLTHMSLVIDHDFFIA